MSEEQFKVHAKKIKPSSYKSAIRELNRMIEWLENEDDSPEGGGRGNSLYCYMICSACRCRAYFAFIGKMVKL
jgi:hypothetical protein